MSALSPEEHMVTVTKIFPRIGLVRKTKEKKYWPIYRTIDFHQSGQT
jgi:hypothetical protein